MSKFNLKTYEKHDGNLHTDRGLKEQHGNIPEEITDKQLSDNQHVKDEKTQITEKQLDAVRHETDERTIEGRLNTSKSRFNIKYRNEDAFTGDINKLEEKRISSKETMEKEEYELSSDTNKKLRWWEAKTNDGLKLAKIENIMRKLSQTDDTDDDLGEVVEDAAQKNPKANTKGDAERFERLETIWDEMEEGVGGDKEKPTDEKIIEEENEVGKEVDDGIFIAEKRENINPSDLPYAAYYKIGYDPDFWPNKSGLKQAIINHLLEIRPDLANKIDADYEFLTPDKSTSGGNRYYSLRLFGDEYSPEFQEEEPENAEGIEDFVETDFGPTEVGGTKLMTGKVHISENVGLEGKDLLDAISDFVSNKHPEIQIGADSIDVDASGEFATYVISSEEETATEIPSEETPKIGEEFQVVEEPSENPIEEQVSAEMSTGETSEKEPEGFQIIDDTEKDDTEKEFEGFQVIDDTKKLDNE